MQKLSKLCFNIAACKALSNFLLDKCSFNLMYKSFALHIYCFPLVLLIKLYIPPLFNESSQLHDTLSLSCKLLIVKIGVGVSKLNGFEVE